MEEVDFLKDKAKLNKTKDINFWKNSQMNNRNNSLRSELPLFLWASRKMSESPENILKEKCDKNQVFYQSFSQQWGRNPLEKMTEEILNIKFYLFFVWCFLNWVLLKND